MELIKVKNYKEIYENQEFIDLVSSCLFNAKIGKIQSVAQSLYSKHQGLFYKAIVDGEIVGIIGAKKIDGIKLELHHIAVIESERGKGLGKDMIFRLMDIEKVYEMFCEVDHKKMEFFKKSGFKCKLIKHEMLGSENYSCELFI